jgi:hypothetical protein
MARTKQSRNVRTMTRMAELAVAAPQVVAVRTARMIAAGANPGAADRAEFSGMHTEKVQAFWESMSAMALQTMKTQQQYAQNAALQWWRLWTTPWWLAANRSAAQTMSTLLAVPSAAQRNRAVSDLAAASLGPVHKRATANARRLTGGRKR